jgi:hypothetical protein
VAKTQRTSPDSRKRRHAGLAAAALVIASFGFAGCGSTNDESSGPACDEATIQRAIEASLAGSESTLVDIEGVECADGWAVAFPTISEPDFEYGITGTMVFRAEGDTWIPQDRREVCGTYDPAGDPENPAYPNDAQVPEAIWLPACNTN